MGHIYSTIKISNIERSIATEVEAVVDTGATLTVIPENLARELELGECSDLSLRGTLVPKQSQIDDGSIELQRSAARISINGRESVQDVLISDFVDRVLLGAVTLKAPALSVDPLTRQLKEGSLLLYCFLDPEDGRLRAREKVN